MSALAALPVLAPGITVATLRRVWFATPADQRREASFLLNSSIMVRREGALGYARLRDLTLPEVEAAIGAVTPRFFVRWYQEGRGIQVTTFVELADAETFSRGKRLHAMPARVQPLTGKGG